MDFNREIVPSKDMIANLDYEQLKAVSAPIKDTCVFAIAGSGKTRVLTYRVANLIYNGIKESELILLTFTNKASNEMISRIKALLNKDKLNLLAGTFHSVASKFLRKYGEFLGYSNNFNIIDSDEQKTLLQSCRNLYIKNYQCDSDTFPAKNVLAEIYSGAINCNMTFVEYLKKYYPYIKGVDVDGVLTIFEDYVNRKKETNLMDFDDLLLNFLDLLTISDIKKEITDKFRYIFVDEYQDVNWIQYELLERLNSSHSLFVIGDSAQCIYQFRGSNDKYIDNFMKTHSGAQSYSLTYNYRSTPEILDFAQYSIRHNQSSRNVILNTQNEHGNLPYIIGSDNEYSGAMALADHIELHHSKNLNKVAILVRKRSQMSIIEKALKNVGVSCNMLGCVSMYQTEHIRDLMGILQFINNPANEPSFLRTIKLFSGIGIQTAEKIRNELKSQNYDLNKINEKKYSKKVITGIKLLKSFYNLKYTHASDLLYEIYNSFYKSYMQSKLSNIVDRLDDIDFLLKDAAKYTTISEFLDEMVLEINNTNKTIVNNSVTITTMHKSKGLEWDYVYLPFINKSDFPKANQEIVNKNTTIVQNERKLFYVSITRAKRELVITYTMSYQNKNAGASVFLEELNSEFFEHEYI